MTWACCASPHQGPRPRARLTGALPSQCSPSGCRSGSVCCGNSGGPVLFEPSRVVTHQESSWRVLGQELLADPAPELPLAPEEQRAQPRAPPQSPRDTRLSPGKGRPVGLRAAFSSPSLPQMKSWRRSSGVPSLWAGCDACSALSPLCSSLAGPGEFRPARGSPRGLARPSHVDTAPQVRSASVTEPGVRLGRGARGREKRGRLHSL